MSWFQRWRSRLRRRFQLWKFYRRFSALRGPLAPTWVGTAQIDKGWAYAKALGIPEAIQAEKNWVRCPCCGYITCQLLAIHLEHRMKVLREEWELQRKANLMPSRWQRLDLG